MTYKLSDFSLKKRKQNLILMGAFLTLIVPITIITLLVFRGETINWGLVAGISLGIGLLINLELFIVGKIMLKKVADSDILFTEDAIIRRGGKKEEEFSFASIQQIKVIKNDKMPESMIIKIHTRSGKLFLAGFDNMQDIHDRITALPIKITRKHQRFDWTNPKTTMLLMLVMTPFMILLTFTGKFYTEIFSPLVQIALGLYFIIGKPMSTYSGDRFKRFELILGLFIIAVSIFNIIVQFYNL
jgi:hypothetical protein